MDKLGFVTIGGTRIHYRRSARPDKPTLLMLAPWPLTVHSFGAAWPTLERELDVIGIDLPGFGHSDEPAVPASPSSLASFLVLVLDHFELERVHLLGTDVGVPVALSFAEHHDDRCHSLVLSDGPGTTTAKLGFTLRRMVGSRLFRSLSALSASTFVRTAVRNGYVRRRPSADELADSIAAYRVPGRLAGTLRFIATYPTELPVIDAGLGSITTPVLLLWGGSDRYVPPDNAHELHTRLATSEVRILEGAGHFCHDDDPDGYAAEVVAWCRDRTPSGA